MYVDGLSLVYHSNSVNSYKIGRSAKQLILKFRFWFKVNELLRETVMPASHQNFSLKNTGVESFVLLQT